MWVSFRSASTIWDSIANDQKALPLSAEQRSLLDQRLDAHEADEKSGRLLADVLADIKRKL